MPKVPRFSSFTPASEIASQIKQRNRSRDTKAELVLRKELWRRGLRYRLHASDLPGKPDIVFRRSRVVVFCDGDFWHGRRWRARREKLARGANAPYWTAKIAANVARDRRNTRILRASGWTVIRLWETDILRDVGRAAARVEKAAGPAKGKDVAKMTSESKVTAEDPGTASTKVRLELFDAATARQTARQRKKSLAGSPKRGSRDELYDRDRGR